MFLPHTLSRIQKQIFMLELYRGSPVLILKVQLLMSFMKTLKKF